MGVHRTKGTGEVEWYTPREYVERARKVLGCIEIDPASSVTANKVVRARNIFTKDENGLDWDWWGRVWLNPPYSQPQIAQFAEKLVYEYQSGRTPAAVVLTHNYSDTKWFHVLAGACSAICFPRGRIRFVSPEGKKASPTQGQTFFYFGAKADLFADVFGETGLVVQRYKKG